MPTLNGFTDQAAVDKFSASERTCAMLPVQLTRRAMYDLVWSKPMTKVAAEFGISDLALKKIRDRHRVPTPGRGYWARKESSQPGKRVPNSGEGLYHRYNAALKRVLGNKGRARMTLEAALAWLEGDPSYAWTVVRRRRAVWSRLFAHSDTGPTD